MLIPTALYMHVPFCTALCHYCDFAKTANYSDELIAHYLQRMHEHLALWCAHLPHEACFTSLYLGGGTPSLLSKQYMPLFESCAPYLASDCEITLEANPQDITRENLQCWQALGINRLSLGVQTFHASHLRFLRRTHTGEQAQKAVWQAAEFFGGELSVDMIYGFPQQTIAELEADIALLLALPLAHVSLYNLIYEAGTPIGRAQQRGKLNPLPVEIETQMYALLCKELAAHGYKHYEVSNWAKPSKHSRHNSNYWRDAGYIGIGAGAHGYLPAAHGAGLRYSYVRNERTFTKHAPASRVAETQALSLIACTDQYHQYRPPRPARHGCWNISPAACALLMVLTCSASEIKAARALLPTPELVSPLPRGKLRQQDNVLYLHRAEWWRENFWVQRLLPAFNLIVA